MKLPYRQKVIIPKEKLTEYLLSSTHLVGKFKAKFFRRLGYDESNVDKLIVTIRKIAQNEEVVEKASSPYGTKYIIEGKVTTPSGKRVLLQTVWIIESFKKRPRFVTAYPL